MKKITIILITVICAVGCISNRVGQQSNEKRGNVIERPEGLVLQIASNKTLLRKGESPSITITIINRGKTPVTLVHPGDGSISGMRTPVVGWSTIEADDPEAKHPPTPPLQFHGCGNINSLRPDEVFVIPPGESKQLNKEWIGVPNFYSPGTYKVVFYYFNNPRMRWKGIPLGGDPKTMKRIKRSFKCSLISNELVFVIGS